jgi:RNA polymerase sigma factor (sigma-70 family)
MSEGQRSTLLAYLRRLSGAAAMDGSDAELLERFIAQREETAFEALLRRHGPLVWSVCRRVLAEEHAAEDAFQATFLVLVRKARSVSKQASIRSWLYGVALRVALRARQQENLRRRREQETPSRPSADAASEATWQDVRPILDEEIQRLPEKYRLPIILCYLEGQTNDEAAQQLNCPRGTIATRLARARERLRSRLLRRGVTLSAATLAALLSDNAMSATVPPLLVGQTAKVVLSGAASVSITTLTEGVLHAMFLSKLKMVLTMSLMVAVLGSAGVCAYYLRAQEPGTKRENPAQPPDKPAQPPDKKAADKAPEKNADDLKALLQERLKLAQDVLKLTQERLKVDINASFPDVVEAFERVLKADLELSPNKAARIAAHQRHVKAAEEFARNVDGWLRQGVLSKRDGQLARYLLIDAKVGLEREKARK